MSRFTLCLAAALSCAAASAQFWKTVGYGTIGPTSVQTLYGDSVSDRLLAGGTFMWIKNEEDTLTGMGQAAWNGSRWDSIAHRIQPVTGNNSTFQTYWFLRFEGALYACGNFPFQTPDSVWNSGLARLNEQTMYWEALECINEENGGMSTLVPKEPQGTLYATGYKGSLCGYPVSCVFRYDGSAFYEWPPFALIPDESDNYVGTVFDFKGKTYMTCRVLDPVGPGYVTFLRYNGSAWEHVPGWNTLSPIKDISIRSDTLYVAGTFTLATGGPGNLVASFDGENWSDMGGGLSYVSPASGAGLDLQWFQGELWACGLFDHAGGVPAHSIAKWDGQRWCAPPGDFRQDDYNYLSALSDMAVWRDSLYVCGSIAYIDWEPVYQVAQWIGGDAVDNCSSVGILEGYEHLNALTLSPLPGGSFWLLGFPHAGAWDVQVYDAVGNLVLNQKKSGSTTELDFSTAATGVYIIRAINGTEAPRTAKLLRQ